MNARRRIIVVATAAAVLAVGGGGIAYAVVAGSDEQVTGPAAEQARTAALKAAGGGTVLEVERDDGDSAFEVEVRRHDGSQVEVHLDDRFQPVGTEPDDDTGAESEDDAEEAPGGDD